MNKPNVLFIVLPYIVHNIDVNRSKVRSFLAFPYGLLSVATYNKDYANIHIIDCDADPDYWISIIKEMKEFKPEIVGLSIMFDNSYRHLGTLLELIRKYDPNVITVLGGAAASYSFEEILGEQPRLDGICYSEGELPFRRLLESKFPRELLHSDPSWITLPSLLRQAPQISYIENLDDVIDIDYSFVNPSAYDMQEAFSPFAGKGKKKIFFLVTSRGCFGKCTFCSNTKIHGRTVRQASIDRIIGHVRHLVDDYGMEVLIIYDDQLLYRKERAKQLFRELAQFNLRIDCPNGLSPAFIDDELAELMRKAGLDTAMLAIESGSEYVLTQLIKKPLKLHMVKPAVKALQAQGIFCHGFFVLGMPGETDFHRQETVDFIRDIGLNWSGLNMATPLRGSPLYEECIKNGWIKKQRIEDIIDKKYVIEIPGIDPEEITRKVNDMNIQLNFHENHAMRHGDYATATACFRQVLERYSGHKWAKYYLDVCLDKLTDR